MAFVHPSRMGLVPQEGKDINPYRSRGKSPESRNIRTNSPSREERRERRGHEQDDRSPRHRDSYHDRDRGRSNRNRRSRERDRSEEGGRQRRRGSPEYGDFKRDPPPHQLDSSTSEPQAPWRKQENMYPNKRGDEMISRDRYPHAGGSYGGAAGADFLESRRLQREAVVVDVWPASPKAPARALSPERKSKSKKSKRHRSPSTSSGSSSEEERRRRERKEKKRARKESDREERKRRKRRSRSRSRRKSYSDDSEEERKQSKRSKSECRSRSREAPPRSKSPSSIQTPEPEEDEWVEKPISGSLLSIPAPMQRPAATAAPAAEPQADDDSDDEVGPQPIQKLNASKRFDERAYGSALLRGEGSAMAAFLQDGTEARIPRRGEIGLTSDEIAQYEDVGYVMSGSRHRRMNAVRMRKENQVISAEEKRGILKLQKEERERREAILREEFSELVSERLKGSEARSK